METTQLNLDMIFRIQVLCSALFFNSCFGADPKSTIITPSWDIGREYVYSSTANTTSIIENAVTNSIILKKDISIKPKRLSQYWNFNFHILNIQCDNPDLQSLFKISEGSEINFNYSTKAGFYKISGLNEMLHKADPNNVIIKSTFTTNWLEEVLRPVFPHLPNYPIKINDTWSGLSTTGSITPLLTKTKYTYHGIRPYQGRLSEYITSASEISPAATSGDLKISVSKYEISGEIWLDNLSYILLESKTKTKIILVTEIANQNLKTESEGFHNIKLISIK